MHQDGSLPRARRDGLLEETVGEELLLYDQNSHTGHCLSPIAACVWRHCDGEHNLTGLAQFVGASEDLVADALHELREKDLLDSEAQSTQSTVSGISRRDAIVRAARYGAAAAAVPLIVSATAATPAMASSSLPKCKKEPLSINACCICLTSCGSGLTETQCKESCTSIGSVMVTFEEHAKCE
jgi:hypothetical protein